MIHHSARSVDDEASELVRGINVSFCQLLKSVIKLIHQRCGGGKNILIRGHLQFVCCRKIKYQVSGDTYEVREVDLNSPEAIPEKRCYTVEELQIILEVSRPTVYNLIRQKQFRAFQVAGGGVALIGITLVPLLSGLFG